MQAQGISEFLAVARSGSFTRAAETLDVSVPHVSRQVRRLESDLGVALFLRSTRSVRLTPTGERLRAECEEIAQRLEQALGTARAADTSLSGRIRVAALSGTFTDTVLAPAFAEFAATHPEIELDIDFSPRRIDLLHEGFDLAIRASADETPGLTTRVLANRRRIAAASPDYLEEFGAPARPADLRRHACIRSLSNTWSFTENGRRRDVAVHGRLRFNAGSALREACERGLGIAYMAEEGYGDALATGRVVPVLEPYWRADATIYAVYPTTDYLPERLSRLIAHLEQEAARRTPG